MLASEIARQPYRERLRAQLALALYRAGRSVEALRAIAEARRLLRDDIGVEPGPELRQLEAAILAHDTDTLAWIPPLEDASRPLPAAAPPDVVDEARFGRAIEEEHGRALLDRLADAWRGARDQRRARAGKSSLLRGLRADALAARHRRRVGPLSGVGRCGPVPVVAHRDRAARAR